MHEQGPTLSSSATQEVQLVAVAQGRSAQLRDPSCEEAPDVHGQRARLRPKTLHATLINLEAAVERLAREKMRVPKTTCDSHMREFFLGEQGEERGVHRKKAQGKKWEKLTQSYVRVDGLSGGGVCGLGRVNPISRPALVGEVRRWCVRDGVRMYRCR